METGEKHKKVGCMNNIAKTVAKCTKWPWVKILKSDNYAENVKGGVLLHARESALLALAPYYSLLLSKRPHGVFKRTTTPSLVPFS